MSRTTGWNSTEQLAWTGHDGPGRPPSATIRPLWLGLAAVLSIVFAGLILSDSLCPEHRAWVQALGAVALIGTATSVVALLRGWAAAPVITLVSASAGVAIGVIDATHDATRGRAIAVAFGITIVGAAVLYARQLVAARWARRALAEGRTHADGRAAHEPTSAPMSANGTAATEATEATEVATKA